MNASTNDGTRKFDGSPTKPVQSTSGKKFAISNDSTSQQQLQDLRLTRLLSKHDVGSCTELDDVKKYTSRGGIHPRDASATNTPWEHVLGGKDVVGPDSWLISTSHDPHSIVLFADHAVKTHGLNGDTLFVANIKIKDNPEVYIDLSNKTDISRQHRRDTGVDDHAQANLWATSMSEVLLKTPIAISEIENITKLSDFVDGIGDAPPKQTTVVKKDFPPYDPKRLGDRNDTQVENNIELLDVWIRNYIIPEQSHLQGVVNELKNVNGVWMNKGFLLVKD